MGDVTSFKVALILSIVIGVALFTIISVKIFLEPAGSHAKVSGKFIFLPGWSIVDRFHVVNDAGE